MGIAPAANVRAISIFGGLGSAAAIPQAADLLSPGDIILIELHRPGPRFNFPSAIDQRGYIAIEWWPDDYAAIRYAMAWRHRRRSSRQWSGEPRRRHLRHGGPRLSYNVEESVPPPIRARILSSAPARRLQERTATTMVRTARGSISRTTGRGSTCRAGAATSRPPATAACRVAPMTFGSPTRSAARQVRRQLSSAPSARFRAPSARRGRCYCPRPPERLRQTGSPQQDAPARPATQRIGNRPDIRAAVAHLTASAVQSGIASQYWNELVAYPAGSAASLWLYVDNQSRKLDTALPSDRSLTLRAFVNAGQRVRVWYQGTDIVGLVVEGS